MTPDDHAEVSAPRAAAPGAIPGLAAGAADVVFASPWQARVFALVLHVYRQGRFTWPEWARYLGAEIAAAREAGRPDDGSTYYEMWLSAAAKLFADKGILSAGELSEKEAHVAANPVPPHGKARHRPVAVDRGGTRPNDSTRA